MFLLLFRSSVTIFGFQLFYLINNFILFIRIDMFRFLYLEFPLFQPLFDNIKKKSKI